MTYKNALPDRKLFYSNTVPVECFNEIIGKEFRKILSQRSWYWFQETDLCFDMHIRFIFDFCFHFIPTHTKPILHLIILLWFEYRDLFIICFLFFGFLVLFLKSHWLCFNACYKWKKKNIMIMRMMNGELSYVADDFEQNIIESHFLILLIDLTICFHPSTYNIHCKLFI